MSGRIELEREILLEKISGINPEDMDFTDRANKIGNMVQTFACPLREDRETTISPYPRQYACFKNAIRASENGRIKDAWWEIYDFVTASKEKDMTFMEMWLLSMMFEFFADCCRRQG